MALTAEKLAEVLSVDLDTATRLLSVATATIENYCPNAPEEIKDEAAIRFCAWLNQRANISIRQASVGGLSTSYLAAGQDGFRRSGAMGLLSPFKQRTAGVIG